MNNFIIVILTFFKLNFFSFGGGYAVFPIIEQELARIGIYFNIETVNNIIMIANICPGPLVVNLSSSFVYMINGFLGSIIISLFSIGISSIIIVSVFSFYFFRIYKNKYIKYSLRGIQLVVIVLIFYTIIKMLFINGIIFIDENNKIYNGINLNIYNNYFIEIKTTIIILISLFLLKIKLNQIIIFFISGILSCLFFYYNIF